jgi:phage repressor protein C with HTH and peptisase S24 domain
MFLLKLDGGLFQAAERGGARVPIRVMDITQERIGNVGPVSQGLLLEARHRGADGDDGLVDHAHGGQDRRGIPRLSTDVSRETRNPALAEIRDLGKMRPMSKREDARRKAIQAVMAAKNLKVKPWAAAAGIAEGGLRDYLSKRTSSMTVDAMDRLAAAADTTISELIGERPREIRAGRDVVPVKSLEVRASMGGGFEVVDEPEGLPFFFRRQWIEKILEGMPGQLRVIPSLVGDSMTPTINDGDAGLVHMAGVNPVFQPGAIYALWDGHGLLVKRLESMVGDRPRLRVISDNRQIYSPYEVDAESVRIIGRLIWRGGMI